VIVVPLAVTDVRDGRAHLVTDTAVMSSQLVTRHRWPPARPAMTFRECLTAEITLLQARRRGRRPARKVRAARYVGPHRAVAVSRW
jgi:hypothetical protein